VVRFGWRFGFVCTLMGYWFAAGVSLDEGEFLAAPASEHIRQYQRHHSADTLKQATLAKMVHDQGTSFMIQFRAWWKFFKRRIAPKKEKGGSLCKKPPNRWNSVGKRSPWK
jgi:hypothetical protein